MFLVCLRWDFDEGLELGHENEGELDSGSKSRPINLATRFGVFVPGESVPGKSSVLDFVALVLIWMPACKSIHHIIININYEYLK